MDAAIRDRQSRALAVTGATGLIVLIVLFAMVAVTTVNDRQESVRLSQWSAETDTRLGGATAIKTQVDFQDQTVVEIAGEPAFVLPLTALPVAGEARESAPEVIGALIYRGVRSLDPAALDHLLADIQAMGNRGPIVSLPARVVTNAATAPAIERALSDRALADEVPVFEMRNPQTGGLLVKGILSLAALMTFGTVAGFVVQARREAAMKVGPPPSMHYTIAPYAPQMVTGEDGMPALYKAIRPLSAADRPMEVYSVTATRPEVDLMPESEAAVEETDPALLEALAPAAVEDADDGIDPAEEIKAAVRAAEERRRAEREAALAKRRAEAEAKRQKEAQQQSEDEALAILDSVAATVSTPEETGSEHGGGARRSGPTLVALPSSGDSHAEPEDEPERARPMRPVIVASGTPTIRAVDQFEDDAGMALNAAALAATLTNRDNEMMEALDDGGRSQGKIDRATLLMAARLGESSRHDLGLTQRETKKVANDPFVKRLDKLN